MTGSSACDIGDIPVGQASTCDTGEVTVGRGPVLVI